MLSTEAPKTLLIQVPTSTVNSPVFIDSAKITVRAGDGGHGLVAFRRERYLPKGGPSGGDGGRGGDVMLLVDAQLSTLHDLRYHRIYKAKRGGNGSGSNRRGADGTGVTIRVPPGTVVKKAGSGEVLVDLTEPGEQFAVAQGGAGGFGNTHFKTARNQSPREATDGRPGEEREIDLELKVLADVGLVGFPNAGKSTLLARLSAAHPKVADYPFTTTQPHLGIVKYGDFRSFVMADIPGLIEGASAGKGLGLQFLRHIERTRLLLYLIDATQPEPVADQFAVLRRELDNYAAKLSGREFLVVLTKRDAWDHDPDTAEFQAAGYTCRSISAVTGAGLDELVQAVGAAVERLRQADSKIK
ncbi:MAG: GTPase ObgE [Candidatus Neomarinimicrobiota bacterium]